MAIKNIIVLMADQFRADALGHLGHQVAQTPNLDRLASQSVAFSNCFCQGPMCAPSRASIATGRYPHMHGVTRSGGPQLRSGERTMAHDFRDAGFRTYYLGPTGWQRDTLDKGYDVLIPHHKVVTTLSPEQKKINTWERSRGVRSHLAGASKLTIEQRSGPYLAKQAIELLRNNGPDRFILWFCSPEPHPPWFAPQEIWDRISPDKIDLAPPGGTEAQPHPHLQALQQEYAALSEQEIRQLIRGYYAMGSVFDVAAGRVLDALDDLGLTDDTAVIFASDHGEQLWDHNIFGKEVMYEGSVRVPLYIRAPGLGKPGCRLEALTELLDLYPTLLELAGINGSENLEGRSLLPLLQNSTEPDKWRSFVFSELETKDQGFMLMIRNRQHKLICYDNSPEEFYDLEADPQEHCNLIKSTGVAGLVKEFSDTARDWLIGQ